MLRGGWIHQARNTTDETSTTINSSARKNLQRRLEAEYQILQLALDASVNYGAKRRRGLQKGSSSTGEACRSSRARRVGSTDALVTHHRALSRVRAARTVSRRGPGPARHDMVRGSPSPRSKIGATFASQPGCFMRPL